MMFHPSEEDINSRISEQCIYIDKQIEKFTGHKKYRALYVRLDIPDVPLTNVCNATQDIARNLFQQFFKKMTKPCCENCKISPDNIKQQLQKAHHVGLDRRSIMMKILESFVERGYSTVSGDELMHEFIMNHKEVPIWTLCRQCHRMYDK